MKSIFLVIVLLPLTVFSQSMFMHIYEIEKSEFRFLEALPDNNVLAGGHYKDPDSEAQIPYVIKIDHAGEIVWQ